MAALGLGGLTGSSGGGSMNASGIYSSNYGGKRCSDCVFNHLLNFSALAALAGSQLRSSGGGAPSGAPQQSQEMAVPNELIGCIIGKGGTKIAEIRYVC